MRYEKDSLIVINVTHVHIAPMYAPAHPEYVYKELDMSLISRTAMCAQCNVTHVHYRTNVRVHVPAHPAIMYE